MATGRTQGPWGHRCRSPLAVHQSCLDEARLSAELAPTQHSRSCWATAPGHGKALLQRGRVKDTLPRTRESCGADPAAQSRPGHGNTQPSAKSLPPTSARALQPTNKLLNDQRPRVSVSCKYTLIRIQTHFMTKEIKKQFSRLRAPNEKANTPQTARASPSAGAAQEQGDCWRSP